MKRISNILLLLILPAFTIGQGLSLAMINDPDGYTNVRNGKGTEHEVVAKLLEGELFYCTTSDDSWWEVNLMISSGSMGKLYVHKSRIVLFRAIPSKERIDIIDSHIDEFVAKRREELAEGFPKEFKQSSSYIAELKVEPILSELAELVNQKWDEKAVESLFRYIKNSPGSASEMPGDALAEIFWNNSGKLKRMILAQEGEFQVDLVDRLEFGFENYLYSYQPQNETFDEKVEILRAQINEMK